MSDENLYFMMDEEMSDEMMVIDATGLGSELEIATDYEEPPLTMQLSNLPIGDGLDIGHDGGGNDTSDDDSLESYFQSPNLTYDDGLDSRHDDNSSSSDGSVEYPSFSMLSSHLPFKDRLRYPEEHGYGMSDEDSTDSLPLSTKSSDFSDEDRMDVMQDKGEKVSNNSGVSYRPFIVKLPSLSFKPTIDNAYDKDDSKSAVDTNLNNLESNIAEISYQDKKDVLDPEQDKWVSETSSSDCADFPSYIPSLSVKDGLSIMHEDDNMHIGTTYENIDTSPLDTELPIAFNDNLSSLHEEGSDVSSDNSTLDHKPLKLSNLSVDNGIDPKNKEESIPASDDMNVNVKELLKSNNSPIAETLNNKQDETGDQVSEDCQLELSPVMKKSFSVPIENKLDILHDVDSNKILRDENSEQSLTRQFSSLFHVNELNLADKEQNKTSDIASIEPALLEIESYSLPNENLKNLCEKSGISTSDTIHSATLSDDSVNSSLTVISKNLPSRDKLDAEISSTENKAIEENHLKLSCSLPSEERLNIKCDSGDNEILGGNTFNLSFATKSSMEPVKEKQEDSIEESKVLNNDHIAFSSNLPSENRLNIIRDKDNNEIVSGNTTDLSFKSSRIFIEEKINTSCNESDKVSNDDVEPLPFTSNESSLLNDDKLKVEKIEDDKTSSNDGILETHLHVSKLLDESEKDVKVHDRDSMNSDGEIVDLPPLIMKSSNVNIDNELDFTHDRGGNETSDEENLEPPKKKLKGIDSSNIRSAKKVRFDSDNSCSYDGFNCQFSSEKEIKQRSEIDYDNIDDHLNSNHAGMMEFDILDEFESNDNDNEDRYSDCESDISLDELDAMLEAGFHNPTNANKEERVKEEGLEHEEKEKVLLKVRGKDHFDVLPEGWVEVTHNSGMPIYLHRSSRVCCVSKPYFLGPGSTRKHEIPISAIPCLNYLRELEKEKNQAQETEDKSNGEKFPPAKLECVKETKESGSLDYLAVREYCKKRFEFQTITVKRFKTWAGRRKHQKQLRLKQRPSLPDNTKLITCPLPPASDKANTTGAITKKEFIMNPSGKSPVCILHEYVQHTLRVQPRYIFKELENASTPYGAVVVIGGIEYGSGYGSSKKQAKSEAAKAALDVLIPKMKMFPPDDPLADIQEDVEFFDEVRVEDPRVSELSIKAGQPYPFQILLECLKRNYGMGDTEIDITMKNLKHQKNEFIMKVGKHSVSVICKNKRDGKHRASQAILQLLHPHITTWGSLLRMYGKGSCKTLKEKKEEEQRITELQSQACANKPNLSILRKLKEEMLKYREKMKMKKPIGKLIPEHLELSTSDSNLKNVEL